MQLYAMRAIYIEADFIILSLIPAVPCEELQQQKLRLHARAITCLIAVRN